MANENDSNTPAKDSQGQPLRQHPVVPPRPAQGEVGPDPNNRAENQQDTARELAREFRWVEVTSLIINGSLAVIGIIALCIYHGQLSVMSDTLTEIRNSKADTTRIITASETQAVAADKIAGAADGFSATASTAVEEFKKAAAVSAKISNQATKTAEDALHISERAYVVEGIPQLDTAKTVISVPLLNTGHLPSGEVEIDLFEATFNPPTQIEPEHGPSFAFIVERHNSISHLSSIAPGSPFTMSVPAPKMSADLLNKPGMQQVVVVGTISYNDGFPNTPTQHSLICVNTVYHLVIKESYLMPCNALIELPKFRALDWTGMTNTNN
jgi:hypothetical protein